MQRKVSILGTVYTIVEGNEATHPKLKHNDGYCDNTMRECVVSDCVETDIMSKGNLTEHKLKLMRHEVIHAFLYESGLSENSDWAMNEEMVDWFAYQFPKLLEVFRVLGCAGEKKL